MAKKTLVNEYVFKKKLQWARGIMLNATEAGSVIGPGKYLGTLQCTNLTDEVVELRDAVREVYTSRKELLTEEFIPRIDFYVENQCGRQEAEFHAGIELQYHQYYDIIDIDSAVPYSKSAEYLARVNQYSIWKRRMLKAKTLKQVKYIAYQVFSQQKVQPFSSNFPAKYAKRFWKFYNVRKARLQRIESQPKITATKTAA